MQCLLMDTVGGYEIGTVYTAHMRRSVIILSSFADLLRGNIDKDVTSCSSFRPRPCSGGIEGSIGDIPASAIGARRQRRWDVAAPLSW